MDKNTAIRLIQDVFQNSFDREQYIAFCKNLFNYLDTEKNFLYSGNLIPDAYDPYIKTLERIGKYKDAEENKIDVLIVHLKKEHSIEHARTMQRNFIAWYLGGSRGDDLKDAALVAFHTDNSDDWRFSLVQMDYQIVESETGKIKTKTELTPARRFSFLVGKNEDSHTAQRQLLPILQNDKNNPLLSDFEKAFNIEVVTQEFFERYKSLFLDVKDSLEGLMREDRTISKDFIDKGVDPVDFSKKLLGQIVFLYFLQKKGWFGVGRDNSWGTGPKNFLRLLFEKMVTDYKNFFNDVLEPLFYEALAKERDDDFYSRFNCKIPFLNGGLFDPINNYDWVHTDIKLPDELFSNTLKTKQGDVGTGILDIFDRYNFTVKEDEPLEKEVAVDPEMLGKVFENLLEVKDRKSKGTYYTPREIVHYMCKESLINYLASKCEGKVNRKDIETLVFYGEQVVEHDGRVVQEGKETSTYSYKLPESIRKNAKFIDDKLKSIRVCDPAIGSGAFPVGMMNEIIRTRNTLTNYLKDKKERLIYNFKRDAIQNSLYGVDIDPGAVEIAKLRLWLSLVVDEQDIKQIKPLPNLDYKIVCGNSLLNVDMQSLFIDYNLQQIEKLKEELFNETNIRKKQGFKEQIDKLIAEVTDNNKTFDFEIYFSEVFEGTNKKDKGFDIVIGNPPWEKVKPQDPEFFRIYDAEYRKKSKAEQRAIKEKLLKNPEIKKDYQFFLDSRHRIMEYAVNHYKLQGSSDLNYYKLFLEKSLEISRLGVCWVIPGSITIDEGSFDMRKYIIQHNFLESILGFSNKEGVFKWIDNNQKFVVLSLSKEKNNKNITIFGWLTNAYNIESLKKINIDDDFYRKIDESNYTFYLDTTSKSFELLEKLLSNNKIKPLRQLRLHYWREYDATMDQRFFDDQKGKFKLFSGKVIDQFDCMAKSWLDNHGRSSKWKVLTFPKDGKNFRTEYYVSEIPDRIKSHHAQDNSNFRIVIQNVTGTINNLRTVYACALHKNHLTNNSLHNLYIGKNDTELFYYLAILNSFVLDWQARIKVATNLNKFILESFLFPDFDLVDSTLRNKLSSASYWLSNISEDFNSLKSKFPQTTFHNREEAQVAINVLAAKLYELNYSELEFVLSYFSLVDESFKKTILKRFKES